MGGTGEPVPVLIDTDPGVDDALALLLALSAPGWRVEAITTVAGNVPVEQATRNVARILGSLAVDPPPLVGVGAAGPRRGPLLTATDVHGPDGLAGLGQRRGRDGQALLPEAPLARHPGGAADLLVASARRWPGRLVVVALGPLTNLAESLDRDQGALRRVARVVVMGGAVKAPGNVTATAEFNVYVDPESAARVLGAALPLTLVPLDVTRQAVWSEAGVRRLARATGRAARCAHLVGQAALALPHHREAGGLVLHDPLAVAVALDPTLVETEELPLTVELEGRHTRGMTVADRRVPPREAWPRCHVAMRVDAARFGVTFEEVLWHGSA